MRDLAIACIVAGCLTLGASQRLGAQDRHATWAEALDTVPVSAAIPSILYVPGGGPTLRPCGPDSALPIVLIGGGSSENEVALYALGRDDEGKTHSSSILPPASPDSLRGRVVRTFCGQFGGPEFLLIEAGGRYVTYRWARTGSTLPRLLAVSSDGTERSLRATADGLEQVATALESAAAAAESRRRRVPRYRELGWSQQDIDAVVAGQVRIGMSTAMVREALGGPVRVSESTAGGVRRDVWWYPDGRELSFTDRKLTEMRD